MRLRPSQFVLLLLLACSLQMQDDRIQTLRRLAHSTSISGHLRGPEVSLARQGPHAGLAFPGPAQHIGLPPAALASHRLPWTMPYPASAAASLISFTGLLRA